MKALKVALVLCFSFYVLFSPTTSFASVNSVDLDSFLASENMTEEELHDLLKYYYDTDLESINSVEELTSLLGEKLTEESLEAIAIESGFTSVEDLTRFLRLIDYMVEDSTILDSYKYEVVLLEDLSYYTTTPNTETSLQEWLSYMEVSKEEVEALFAEREDSISNYAFIEQISEVYYYYNLTLVTPESLQVWLDSIGKTLDEVTSLFEEHEDVLSDYKYIEYLQDSYDFYSTVTLVTPESLQVWLDSIGKTLDEVTVLFEENDDDVYEYKYIEHLDYAYHIYKVTPITEENLQAWLTEIGKTKEEVDALFAEFQDDVANYETIEDLTFSYDYYSLLTVTPLTEESLQAWLTEIGKTKEEVSALFEEFEDEIGNYHYIEQLSLVYESYVFEKFIGKFGLTLDEITAITEHMLSLYESLDTEEKQVEFDNQLAAINERIAAMSQWEVEKASDLTEAQVEELTSILSDQFALFGLKLALQLEKEGQMTDVSIADLLKLDNSILKDFKLAISLLTLEDELLVDFDMTDELLNEHFSEFIEALSAFLGDPVTPPDNGNNPGDGNGGGNGGDNGSNPNPPVISPVPVTTQDSALNGQVLANAASGVVPADSKLVITSKTVSDKTIENIKKQFGGNSTYVASFDISLVDKDGVKIQPNGKMQLKMKVPEQYKNDKNLVVVFIAEDGTVQALDTTIVDGYAVFETDHFSNYALVKKAESTSTTPTTTLPRTGENHVYPYLIATAFVLLSAIFVTNRRNRKVQN